MGILHRPVQSHDVVFAAAQDLGVPFAIHPTFEPQWTKGARMGDWENVKQLRLLASVTASDGVRHQFTSLFDYGVFDRFPRLKVLVLESGGGWIGYWLDRMDTTWESPQGNLARQVLPEKPGAYFRRQCWISADPDETALPGVMEVVGADRFFWASDFPHPDHPPEYIPNLEGLILHRQVITPWDLERTYGLTEGNIFHGELSLEQLAFQRPVAGWAEYKTPVRRLWMCGSGTHPGGGLMAAPGALCARAILGGKA